MNKISFLVSILACFTVSSIVHAQTKSDAHEKRRLQREIYVGLRKGNISKPERIRSPNDTNVKYRDVSVSDIEIEEIKSAYQSYYKEQVEESLVSIGPVTNGCECEVKSCTNEVFLSYQSNHVLFSKISEKWHVSSLHKWWEEYRTLYKKLYSAKTDAEEVEILYKIQDLYESAPECDDAK